MVKKKTGITPWLLFGFFAALVFLARTDNAFVVITLYSALMYVAYKSHRIPAFIISGITGVIFVLPWLLWNYLYFGAIVQSSGLAGGIYWYQDIRESNTVLQNAGIGVIEALRQIDIVSRSYLVNIKHNMGLWTGLIFIALATFLFFSIKKHHRVLYKSGLIAAPFIIGLLLTFSYHTFVRAFVRIWYEAPLSLAFILVLAVSLCYIGNRLHELSSKKLPVSMPAFLGLFLLLLAHPPMPGLKNEGKTRDYDRLLAANWINRSLPEDAVLGAGNAGIQAYYSHRKLINLDGVVNIHAHNARMERRFNEYLFNSGVEYIIENDGGLTHYCNENPFYTCAEVGAFGQSKRPVKIVRVEALP